MPSSFSIPKPFPEAWFAVLERSSLFGGCSAETFRALTEPLLGTLFFCEKGGSIFLDRKDSDGLFLLLQGEASAERPDVGENRIDRLPLNRLTAGDAFGYAGLFLGASENEKAPGTAIRALEDCTLLRIPEPLVLERMGKDPVFAVNLVTVLVGKIRFLNGKIAAFTADSALEKLRLYCEKNAASDGTVSLDGGMSALAKKLHISRASLYRALDALREEGVLTDLPAEKNEKHGKGFRYGGISE